MKGEAFYEAWERFKILLSQCPHHQFMMALLSQFFYDGLTVNGQTLVDIVVWGCFGDKTTEEVNDIYGMLANSSKKNLS